MFVFFLLDLDSDLDLRSVDLDLDLPSLERTWTRTCSLKVDLDLRIVDLDLDFTVAGLVTSLLCILVQKHTELYNRITGACHTITIRHTTRF